MNKKISLLFLVVVMFFSAATIAQPVVGAVTKKLPKVNLGLKIGADFESLSGSQWQNTYKGGVTGGAFLRVYKGKVGLDVEALINSAQYNFNSILNTETYKAVYLNVPVLFEYKLFHRLWLQVGPQYSPVISFKDNAGNDVKKDFQSGYMSGIVGLQVILPMHFVVGARYVLGLSLIHI